MSKLQKLLKAAKLIMQNPALLNKVLDAPEVNKNELKQKYGVKNGLKTVQINDLLPNLNETIEPFSFLDGGSTPLDLVLLKGLAKRFEACEYFEIGTWRGESVANVANIAKHCTSLNLSDEAMLAMGLDKKYIESHRFFSNKLSNVTHLQGNSSTFDYTSLTKKFDLIFIDGDHHYESVKSDTINAFKLLKNEKSIIVWHDYGNTPTDVRWDVLKGILDGTPSNNKNNLYHVSNTLSAIYTTENIKASFVALFEYPSYYFSAEIKLNAL